MQKLDRRSIGIMVLLMLATSSLSASYSFAEPNNTQENTTIDGKKIENCKKNGLETILTEKIVDGKLEIQQYAFPNTANKEEVRKTMQLQNQTLNWTHSCNTYNSGIVLFDGKASKSSDNFWRVSSEIAKNGFDEWEENGNYSISQKEIIQDYDYQIIFSGNTDKVKENELFIVLNLELSTKLQYYENYVMMEGFDSYYVSMTHNNLEEKTI